MANKLLRFKARGNLRALIRLVMAEQKERCTQTRKSENHMPRNNTPNQARELAQMLQAAAAGAEVHEALMFRCAEALQFMARQVELLGSFLHQAHPLPETDYWDDTADLSAIANEQNEFEEWFAFDAGEALNPGWAAKDGNGNYTTPDVQDSWSGWQARAARVTDVPRAVADNRLLMRAFEAVHQRSAPRDIERHLVKRVKELGGEVRRVTWQGRGGAPNRVVMLPTHEEPGVVWVELKAPGVKPEAYQLREHERMRRMGQRVEVIDSIEGVERLLS